MILRMPKLRFVSFRIDNTETAYEQLCRALNGYSVSMFSNLIEIEKVIGSGVEEKT
jgi:hypothetical protein